MLIANHNRTAFDYQRTLTQKLLHNDCPYFEGIKLQEVIDEQDITKKSKLVVAYNDNNLYKGQFILPVNALTNKEELHKQFINNQVAICDYHLHDAQRILSRNLRTLRQNNQISYSHQNLGWHTIGQNDCFLYDDNTIVNGKKSQCIRQNFRFQCGDETAYQRLLDEEVFPSKELTLAYVIGFAAVVASRLNKSGKDLGTLVVNVSGRSSTGKSTVEQLLISPFGSPVFSKNGLGITHSGTLNGILDALDGIHGLPRVIDDLTQNSTINLTELVYTIAQEEPKMRCGEFWNRQTDGWSGLAVISSESPILEKTAEQGGLYPRVLNLDNVPWTNSKEQAEKVKNVVQNNYGFTGRKFIDYMLKKPQDELCKEFDEMNRRVDAMLTNRDNLSGRIANKIAVIAYTAELVKDCFAEPYKWTTETLIAPFLENEIEGVEKRNPAEKLLEIIVPYARANLGQNFDINFISKPDYQPCGSTVSAKRKREGEIRVDYRQNIWEILIYHNVLMQLLKNNGFNEWQTAADMLKSQGVLIGDKDGDKMRNDKKVGKERYNMFRVPMPHASPSLNIQQLEKCEEQQNLIKKQSETTDLNEEGNEAENENFDEQLSLDIFKDDAGSDNTNA